MSRIVRIALWVLAALVVGGLSLVTLDWLLGGLESDGFWAVFVLGGVIALLFALLYPVLYRTAAAIHPLLFPILIFPMTAALLMLADRLDDAIFGDHLSVDSWTTAAIIGLGMTMVITIFGTVVSFGDDPIYNRLVVDALHGKFHDAPHTDEPGFFLLEIDGLSAQVLQRAIDGGYVPNMQRWLESGSHTLTVWEPDLSSQTSASQAGLLLGDNTGIPAFRWWDKGEQKLLVSSNMQTASLLEHKLANGAGLLEPDGVSRFNVFSGGAGDSVGTFSNLSLTSGGSNSYFAYFLGPYTVGRLLTRFVQDCCREWWENWRQGRNNVEPRLDRPFSYAFSRAGCTAALMEATRFMVTADILRGVPSAYYTIFAYDEVAHHTGVMDPYTMRVLAQIDHLFGSFEDALHKAPRPYHLIVLSDHGQSYGKTFKQRYGITLGELVQSLVSDRVNMEAILDSQESKAHVAAALQDATSGDTRTAKLARRALEGTISGSQVLIENTAPMDEKVGVLGDDQGYVLASGNLGLVSFTGWPDRMTWEEITDAFPQLVPGLVEHEGVGFVMVRSAEHGPIAIGRNGVAFLRDGKWEGENPIAPYGDLAARHLLRTDSFANCPDLLVMSTYWPETGEVAAFEELIGNHGGLGGYQRHPILLHPAHLDPGPDLLVGAAAVNAKLREWIAAEQPSRATAAPVSRTGATVPA